MSNDLGGDPLENLSREEFLSALFANMIFQNTNMALMMLGRVPHPQSGEKVQDFEAARMFIDQLEMLSIKTKGNLSREEEQLVEQSLAHVRLAFVQAVEQSPSVTPETNASSTQPSPEPEPESRKRFSKKF
jgi:hypothetical protein